LEDDVATASVTNTFVTGAKILAAAFNTNFSDLVTFLNGSVLHKDGAVALTGNLSAGSNKITSLAAPAADSDAARRLDTETVIWTFAKEGTLAVATGKGRLRLPVGTWTILGVSAAVNTAPTGATILIDVNKNGTTIFTTQGNRPSIAISAFAAAEVTNMDVTSLTTGDYLTVDIDQIGSTIAGADLTVFVRARRTA
jgi:hypothetical protein